MGAGYESTSKTAKTRKNNILSRNQSTNKVPANIYRGFEVRKNIRLMFSRLK